MLYQKPKLMVLGSYNVDLSTSVQKFPKPGETIMGLGFHKGHGGKGSNQAIAASRLGGNISFVGCLGNDLFGHEAMKMFAEEGIDTRNLIIDSKHPTGTALITVEETGENQIIVNPGANLQLQTNHIEEEVHFSEVSWMIAQLEVPFRTVKRAVELAKEKGVNVILNPAPVIEDIIEILPMIDVITPNETEAEVLTGIAIQSIEDVKKAAQWFLEKGTSAVAITMGGNGVYIATKTEYSFEGEHIPTTKVKAVDTTGAGDCFNGALLVSLSEGKPLKSAAEFAVKAASLSVQRIGAGEAMPYRKEVEDIF